MTRRKMLALTGGAIVVNPDTEPLRDGVLLIDGSRIAAVGRIAVPVDAGRLDCSGCTILAGFRNSHVHFFERKWANAASIPDSELRVQFDEAFTRYGFTSVFDLGSSLENTQALHGRADSLRIRTTGEGLIPPGGAPSETVLAMMGVMSTALPEVANASEAAAAARKLLDAGADGIKLFASTPRGAALSVETMAAAVNEAHRAGKPAFVHPSNAIDVLNAVQAGVDVIAHTTPMSGPWDDALIAAMREANVALTPTLALWKFFMRHDRASVQGRIVETELAQLRAWIAAGGEVLFGTDLGAVGYDPAEEYQLMMEAGMSARDILASLTTAPARRFGDDARIEEGARADLVVVQGDPFADIRALSNVRYTLCGGQNRSSAQR